MRTTSSGNDQGGGALLSFRSGATKNRGELGSNIKATRFSRYTK